ncbi:hypothetical protein ACJZ2D_000431 [Fusarium nematophilum]
MARTPAILPQGQMKAVKEYLSQRRASTVEVSVFGAEASGRHSFLRRLTAGQYSDHFDDPCDDQGARMLIAIDNHHVMLNFWMQLGRNGDLTPGYYHYNRQQMRESEAFVLLYDVTRRDSLDCLESAYDKLFKGETRPIWVCAGKTDRPQTQWAVSIQEGEQFSKKLGARFLGVSAKTGENLDKTLAVEIATAAVSYKISKEANVAGPSQVLQAELEPEAGCLS